MPLTSAVVVPVLNGASTIRPCIESLLAQKMRGPAPDIVIVDNGSTDATPDVVREYPVRLLHEPRPGPAAARNAGIRATPQAEVVALTDADCTPVAHWLQRLVDVYADAAVGGAGGDIVGFAVDPSSAVERLSERMQSLVNFHSGDGEFLPHLYTANASYRRRALDAVEGFNELLVTSDDVDISWRVQLAGFAIRHVPDAAVLHRHRTTVEGLRRQFRQYGYGEVLLDARYGHHPGYPRGMGFQVRRMSGQVAAMARYAGSLGVRAAGYVLGRRSKDDIVWPLLLLAVEASNVSGKMEAIWATRFMRKPHLALRRDPTGLIRRMYHSA
ncbi:MAG: glycosyltransferase family 2 protein [Vicinamibacterales bacterium]